MRIKKQVLQVERGKYHRVIGWIWITFLSLLLLLALFLISVTQDWFGLFGKMPGLKLLENPKSELASEVYTSDNVLIGKYFSQNRSPVEYEQISPHVIRALIATEDLRFYNHAGMDSRSLIRVALGIVTFNGAMGGGSTITQQVAKNLFDTRTDRYEGHLAGVPVLGMTIIKVKEWITSIRLERNYTKEEILAMYLNTVPFGSNAYGIEVAAQTFFNKSQRDVTIEEAALLVGAVNNPSIFNPYYNTRNSFIRRNVVLSKMRKNGFITQTQYAGLKEIPLQLDYTVENQNEGLASYFRSYIRDFLLNWAAKNDKNLFTDGLKIYTTLDSRMQRYAEEAVKANMRDQQAKFYEQWNGQDPWAKDKSDYIQQLASKTPRYLALKEQYGDDEATIDRIMHSPINMRVFSWRGEKDTLMSPIDSIRYYKRFLHTGFMSMDPTNGHVKAWVGGINHKHFQYDHVRQSKRQPGSTFKAIIYAAAIDNGFSPCMEVVNVPVTITNGGYNYTPRNFDNAYDGQTMTLRQAMGRSINTIAAFLMKAIGPTSVVKMARRLGITSPLKAVPSLCLGTSDVSLYEMLGVYSTFVNKGIYTEPIYITRIEDQTGNVLQDFSPRVREALSPETAYLMVHMLKAALQETGGTARALYQYESARNNEIGAKTGTTQNYADGWFIGITPNLVSGVWVGGDEPIVRFRNSNYGQGGRVALPAWGMYMDKIYADTTLQIQKGYFRKPSSLPVSLNCADYQYTGTGDPSKIYIAPSIDTATKKGVLK